VPRSSHYLTTVSRELSELTIVLELLKDDTAASDDSVIPEPLQKQILSIITNCTTVVSKINNVLDSYKEGSKISTIKWVVSGKGEIASLRMSLEAHRGSLNLALELMSISVSKAIKHDNSAIHDTVVEMKEDTSQIPQILAELERLRAIVAQAAGAANSPGQSYVLQQYLDSLTSYAETVFHDEGLESDHESLNFSSGRNTPVMHVGSPNNKSKEKFQVAEQLVERDIVLDAPELTLLPNNAVLSIKPPSGILSAGGQKSLSLSGQEVDNRPAVIPSRSSSEESEEDPASTGAHQRTVAIIAASPSGGPQANALRLLQAQNYRPLPSPPDQTPWSPPPVSKQSGLAKSNTTSSSQLASGAPGNATTLRRNLVIVGDRACGKSALL